MSSPTKMFQYCKQCYSHCSHARILFQYNSSFQGLISTMQKKKKKTCKKPNSNKLFPSLLFTFRLENKNVVLFCDTRIYYTNTNILLLFHILQSSLSERLMSNIKSLYKIWQPFFVKKISIQCTDHLIICVKVSI